MRNEQYKQFNCYSVLNIEFTATPGEIKTGYRKISLKTHPDMGGSNEAQAKVNLAYEILSDPIQRQAHDIYWRVAANRSSDKKNHQPSEHANPSARKSRQQNREGSEPLSAFRKKLDETIQAKKANVWFDLDKRSEIRFEQVLREISEARRVFFYLLSGAAILGFLGSRAPLFWIGAMWLGFLAISKLNGTNIQGKKFSPFNAASEELKRHAESLAARDCQNEVSKLDRYAVDFASIVETAMRSSSYDDSEIHVARRITVALFLMGYLPIRYDSESRSILLADKDEKLVVRFRHRVGAAINISYAERLCGLMQEHNAKQGVLFCSPGLSDNAARFAERNGIKSYSLEEMNAWIDKILSANYSGPSGDILENIKRLSSFLSVIVPKVGYSSRGYRRRR